MKKILLTLLAGVCFLTNSFAQNKQPSPTPQEPVEKKEEKGLTDQEKKDIDDILKEIEKKSPNVQADALRVWKNFHKGKSDPNPTYRQWARSIVLELRNTKNWYFDTEAKVGSVFVYLFNEQKISSDAVFVLTRDVWGYLLYTHGVPDVNPTPQQEPPKQEVPSTPPKKEAPQTGKSYKPV